MYIYICIYTYHYIYYVYVLYHRSLALQGWTFQRVTEVRERLDPGFSKSWSLRISALRSDRPAGSQASTRFLFAGLYLRGWRNTVGNLIEVSLLKHVTGILCVNKQSGMFYWVHFTRVHFSGIKNNHRVHFTGILCVNKQSGMVSSNSRCQTVLLQQYSANLSVSGYASGDRPFCRPG